MRFLLCQRTRNSSFQSDRIDHDPEEVVNTDIHIYIDMCKMTLRSTAREVLDSTSCQTIGESNSSCIFQTKSKVKWAK